MRVLLQRVKESKVFVNSELVSSINQGLLIFLGIGENSRKEDVPKLIKKILELRIFENSEGKISHSVQDLSGELLIISQFTLYASYDKGRRPDFIKAAKPLFAKELYEEFILQMKKSQLRVETGIFAADMKVHLINDGPFTLLLDSADLK